MYFYLINQSEISDCFINQTFEYINTNSQLFQNKNDFVIICSLLSYNNIIALKTLSENNETRLLKSFEGKFTQRIKVLAWFIQSAILILIFYGIFVFISIKPEIKILFDKIGSILKITALIGVSQLGNIFPWLKNLFLKTLLMIFGYPKELMK
jgi:hypothetical protein